MKIQGLPVVDSLKPVHIHITANDVKHGDCKDPHSCAAARACIRDLKLTDAKIHISRIYLRKGDRWMRFITPQALRQEIISFDRGGTFVAGDYTLAPVSPAARLGVKHAPKRTRNKSPKSKVPRHFLVGIRPPAEKRS